MATSDATKYTRINLIVVKGGIKLTRRLFLQRIKDLNPEGDELTVDEFLNNNKTKVLNTEIGKSKSETLFPSSGKTNLDEWDLYLFCAILQDICDLQPDSQLDIEELLKIRNKLCHSSEPVMATDEFAKLVKELKHIFARTCRLINDDIDFESALNADVNQFEVEPLSSTDIAKYNHEFSQLELNRLENAMKTTDPQDAQSKQLKLLSRLEDIGSRHFLVIDVGVDYQGLPVSIDFKNSSNQNNPDALFDFLEEQFHRELEHTDSQLELRHSFPDRAHEVLTEAAGKLFKEFLAKGLRIQVEKKYKRLTIKSETLISFVGLVRNFLNNTILDQLDDLLKAVRSSKGFENVEFSLSISHDEISTILGEIVERLDKAVPREGQRIQHSTESTQMSLDEKRLKKLDSVTPGPMLRTILESSAFGKMLELLLTKANSEIVVSIEPGHSESAETSDHLHPGDGEEIRTDNETKCKIENLQIKYHDNGLYLLSLDSKEKKYAYKALSKHLLPNHTTLNSLAKLYGRKSKLISLICEQVCLHIKENEDRITIYDVWPAVKISSGDITFVVIVKENESTKNKEKPVNNNEKKKTPKKGRCFRKPIEYSYVRRSLGDVSFEGECVINSTKCYKYLSSSQSALLQQSIYSNNVELMKKHKFLMMIAGSPVRSKAYDIEGGHTICEETCIVLYVLIKGYIPITEDPFQTEYDGISVDVREGFFHLYARPAERFENVKSGCQIYNHMFGTLGGFVDHSAYGTCGITCGHVVLNPEEIKCLTLDEEENDMALGISTTGQTVYQPDASNDSHAIGKVVQSIYREGGNGESGIDIVVFQMSARYPDLGDFPDLEDGRPSSVSYDSGRVADVSRLQSHIVYKYGAKTYLTKGEVVLDNTTLSVRTYERFIANTENGDFTIILHNLIEIRSESLEPFAKEGDSGALVFCEGENKESVCVGVVEGGVNGKNCVIMPILPILEKLQVTSLKNFQSNRMTQKINNIEQSITEQLNDLSTTIETKLKQNEQRMQEQLQKSSEQVKEMLEQFFNKSKSESSV